MRTLLHNKSATGIRLHKFGLALKASPPLLSRSRQLIFLCGANQATDVPSIRRSFLKTFIQSVSTSSTVLYAEGVFNELRKFGSQKNLLDLEHKITQIADKIIIILESESAFCELGAFANEELRRKLIVINNAQYQRSQSFINLGPVAALHEVKSPVIWYPMSPSGKSVLDGIGATFPDIEKAIAHTSKHGTPIQYEELSNLEMNKTCLYFVHDIVLFAGPITHEEIISILKMIFGAKSYDTLKNILGVLRAGQMIHAKQVGDKWAYSASSSDFFLKYYVDMHALMAAFRVHQLKTSPERFSHG